jgi:hypothetical protein
MIRRRALAALLSATAAAGLAHAHGPTRQKLELSVELKASPETEWAAIGNFADLSWNPSVASVKATGGNVPDKATRTITLAKGGQIPDEQLTDYDAAKHSYGTFLPHVDPKAFPVADFSSHLIVSARPGGGSVVEYRTAFYRGYPNNDPPPDLNEAAAVRAVTAYVQPALDALKKRFGAAS